ncbi:MAG TPA: HIT family protein [Candidatus Nitrosopolaris sp.]|nr:HIT family protein [Candidatus Nitrosopolaris sp.]
MKTLDENCTFCKIVDGNISARIISQNDKAVAFLDAFPLSVGHTLIIPKRHYSKVQDMNREFSAGIFDLLRIVTPAVEEAAGVKASTIAIHNGLEAGQEILHVHIHLIPRMNGDGAGPVHLMFRNRPKITSEKMDSMLESIKERVELS